MACASKWQWLSMNPGAMTWPRASMVRLAGPASLPVSTMTPSLMATSP